MLSMLAATVTATDVYYGRSSRGHAQSLLARGYVVQAGLASRRYWHEREAMNEYLLRPSPHLLAEVTAESAGVATALDRIAASSPEERTLLMEAHAANGAFKSAFLRDMRKAKAVVTPQLLAEMDVRAQAVFRPLNALARINANEVAVEQTKTNWAADRMHLFAGLALLVFVLTIVLWVASYDQADAFGSHVEHSPLLAQARGSLILGFGSFAEIKIPLAFHSGGRPARGQDGEGPADRARHPGRCSRRHLLPGERVSGQDDR